jgi:hypothetical protein
MSHTIYVTRIILRPLSALFGSQFMLPMETSVTFIGACANEIIRRNNSGFFNKGKEWGHVRIAKFLLDSKHTLEKTKEAINNGQSRENQRDNQQWTIQRKPKRQSTMDNPEKTKEAINNGQSRETGTTGHTRRRKTDNLYFNL